MHAYLSFCLCWSWQPTNGDFQMCWRKPVRSWIPAFQLATYWTDAEKLRILAKNSLGLPWKELLWRSYLFIKLLGLGLVAGNQFHFLIDFAFFEKRLFLGSALDGGSLIRFLFVCFNILVFNGIIFSMTFDIMVIMSYQ